jgi:thymidylate synthase (FAD)
MKIVKTKFKVLNKVNGLKMLAAIENAGRTCYKSENKATPDSAIKFVKNIITRGHESVLEHQSISVRVICDRGVTHEIVRHRIAAYSQESTRYCNYGKDDSITVINIRQHFKNVKSFHVWFAAMKACETAYLKMLELGESPQIARSVLPNSLKTEIVCTFNLREWRHFFRLRTGVAAHPQMRELAIPMLNMFKRLVPVVFDDINV